jgi:DNA-binding PadR family transcriptional regulator
MRRKRDSILPLEAAIIDSGLGLHGLGVEEFHGYLLAKEMKDRAEASRLTAHGTLYKALDRLEDAGYLQSRWEDPALAAAEARPRRRLYHVTAAGRRALAAAFAAEGPRLQLNEQGGVR